MIPFKCSILRFMVLIGFAFALPTLQAQQEQSAGAEEVSQAIEDEAVAAEDVSDGQAPVVDPQAGAEAIDLDGIDPVFFRDVAYELRCPTCVGLSVLESSASFSEQIKAQVREQISAGKDKGEILEFFVERYGPWILREPPKEGFNLVAWLLPTGLLVFGPIVIWLLVWKRRRVVETYGVRSLESVIEDMHQRLKQMRNQ